MKYHVLSYLTAAALLASGVSAHAAASSSAQLSLSINLIDLDTGDGITPSIVFQPGFVPDSAGKVSFETASRIGANGQRVEVSNVEEAKPVPWTPFADVGTSHAGLTSGSASINGNESSVFGPHVFSASGAADALGVGGVAELSYTAQADGAAPFYLAGPVFTLSANTRVEFVANIGMQVATSVGVGASSGQSMNESATARYTMEVRSTTGAASRSSSSDRISARSASWDAPLPDQASFSDVIVVQLANASSASVNGRFTMQIVAQGSSNLVTTPVTGPIPEPESIVLALCGLGVLGGLRLRSRAAASSSR